MPGYEYENWNIDDGPMDSRPLMNEGDFDHKRIADLRMQELTKSYLRALFYKRDHKKEYFLCGGYGIADVAKWCITTTRAVVGMAERVVREVQQPQGI